MDEREREYQEYLSLREHRHTENSHPNNKQTFGESEMRRIYREKAQREQMEAMRQQRRQKEREEYLAARERQHEERQNPKQDRKSVV